MTAWLKPPEMAELLRVEVGTVYDLVRDGSIPHHRIGRLIRFSPEDIATYQEATQVRTPETTIGRSRKRRRTA